MEIGGGKEFGLPDQKKKHIIKVVCAWCKKELGEKEAEMEGTSHGICTECKDVMMKKIDEVKDNLKQP